MGKGEGDPGGDGGGGGGACMVLVKQEANRRQVLWVFKSKIETIFPLT
jgi:hypothetical protein